MASKIVENRRETYVMFYFIGLKLRSIDTDSEP